MTTELDIEREAKLRARKKKVLHMQKLKYLSGNLGITDGNVTATGADDRQFLFTQQRRENSSDHKVIEEENSTTVCLRIGESSANKLEMDGDSYENVNELDWSETLGYTPGVTTTVLPRVRRPTVEETDGKYETDTRPDGAKISITVGNSETEQYTPSFVSGSLEYQRKTSEIKKKADERRRNVVSHRNQHSSLLSLPSNNDYLTVYDAQPRRSASLSELNGQQEVPDFEIKRNAHSSHRRSRRKSEGTKVGSPYTLAERESSLPRASSFSSIYDSYLTSQKHEINFEGFARKQQEILEDSLRRLEENLDSTFTKLRRYVNTVNTISRNQGQT